MFRPTRSLSYTPALNTANELWSGWNTHTRCGTSILSGCLWMRDVTRSDRSLRLPDSSNAAGSHGAHRRYSSFPCEYVNGRGQEIIDRGLTALARSPILGQDTVGCTTRNQLYLDQEVTRIWRPLASHDDRGIYQGSAHAAQELPTSGNCPRASSRRRCSRDLYKNPTTIRANCKPRRIGPRDRVFDRAHL